MAGFNNPFSPKPDYASGFSDIASQIMQMLIMNKMFKGNGQQGQGGGRQGSTVEQLAPTSPLPPARQMPIPQAGGMGGAGGMGQAQGRPQPSPPQGMGMPTGGPRQQNQSPEAMIMAILPPFLQQYYSSQLKGGKWPEPKQMG